MPVATTNPYGNLSDVRRALASKGATCLAVDNWEVETDTWPRGDSCEVI